MRMDGWMDGKETKTMDISQNIQERQHKTNIVTIKCHGSFGLLMVALNIDPVWNDWRSCIFRDFNNHELDAQV